MTGIPCNKDNTKVGDRVRLNGGAFNGFEAYVKALNCEAGTAEVSLATFISGRGATRPFAMKLESLEHIDHSND